MENFESKNFRSQIGFEPTINALQSTRSTDVAIITVATIFYFVTHEPVVNEVLCVHDRPLYALCHLVNKQTNDPHTCIEK